MLSLIIKGRFLDSLQIANITPVQKKDQPTDVKNYWPVCVLPLLSKAFEKLIYDQLIQYYLDNLLCGFWKTP